MARFNRLLVAVGAALLLTSVFLYLFDYLLFKGQVYIYFLSDLAFMPLEVLLVTLILRQVLNEQEKRTQLEKMNMVVGAFYSEVGVRLITEFSRLDPQVEDVREELLVTDRWSDQQFLSVRAKLKSFDYSVDIHEANLVELKAFLVKKREFLVRILENPMLLEHQSFTELLRAVFHITEELEARKSLSGLPESDLAHLALDVKRAYNPLVSEWLDYMKYMKSNYPYLFSLAMRTNPFDVNASPIVK
ncbi:Uncharacterised protein [uncultured archaeon]|nr:Uncharacterised protein [uncultured archaeon]